jgi:hypothetical protein
MEQETGGDRHECEREDDRPALPGLRPQAVAEPLRSEPGSLARLAYAVPSQIAQTYGANSTPSWSTGCPQAGK